MSDDDDDDGRIYFNVRAAGKALEGDDRRRFVHYSKIVWILCKRSNSTDVLCSPTWRYQPKSRRALPIERGPHVKGTRIEAPKASR